MGPLQVWPHGVAVEHTLVWSSEYLSVGHPLAEPAPRTGQRGTPHRGSQVTASSVSPAKLSQRFRSSGTSSLKHMLGPNLYQPVPSASGLVLNPGH